MADPADEWASPAHALSYLERADSIPHRGEGETALLEHLPASPGRVLDIGTGDGRLLGLVLAARPGSSGVALDYSPAMLAAARARFSADRQPVDVVDHDVNHRLPDLGRFDVVVSSFAIHHCPDLRKRALYAEVFAALSPGGVFLNLEHVASPTERLHDAFLAAIGYSRETEDRSNILLDTGTQLRWLREIGFDDVDCHWKWREMALLAGCRPNSADGPGGP
ncbi:MAG: class I SAM-dependent methyltransferase [Actinomycetota bacterium]|nr:class I SAM-dependent methyltransferase [Actinomycetota bacterium]